MVDWTKETKRDLFDRAIAAGVPDVTMNMTKQSIYHATLAHLRAEVAKANEPDDSVAEQLAASLRAQGIDAEVVDDDVFVSSNAPDAPDVTFTPDAGDGGALTVAFVSDGELEAETGTSLGLKVAALPAAATAEVDDIVDEWKAGTELVPSVSTLPEMSRWEQMRAMAQTLCRSPLMPKHIRESRDPEADCLVILLAAHDLGLTTTLALRKIAVIEGAPAQAAELMRMLVRRDGHDIDVFVPCPACDLDVSKPNLACEAHPTAKPIEARVSIRRKEWAADDWRSARFTIDDAVTAQLCTVDDDGNVRARGRNGYVKPWEAYTEDMLVARATSRACRRYAEDSLGGISYTPDELGAIDVEEVQHGPSRPGQEPPRVLSDTERQRVIERIEALSADAQATLRTAWKASGLLTTKSPKPLTEHWLARVNEMIADVEAQEPVDAEIVADVPPCETDPDDPAAAPVAAPPETVTTVTDQTASVAPSADAAADPASTGQADADVAADTPTDREVDGVPDRGGVASDTASPARAMRERSAATLAAAREKFEGKAACPYCQKTLAEPNADCDRHSF